MLRLKSKLLPTRLAASNRVERWYIIRQKASHYRVSLVYYMRKGLPGTTVHDGSWYCLIQRKRLWWWVDVRLDMLPETLGATTLPFRKIVAELTATEEIEGER